MKTLHYYLVCVIKSFVTTGDPVFGTEGVLRRRGLETKIENLVDSKEGIFLRIT